MACSFEKKRKKEKKKQLIAYYDNDYTFIFIQYTHIFSTVVNNID